MSLNVPCPICRADLVLTAEGEFNSWICPAGHGRAATLSELYERAQEDEIRQLWAIAREACKVGIPGGRACPMCGGPTVAIDVPTDADEAPEGAPGDGPSTGTVTVDVCPVDELIWFDQGEVEAFPADLPDAEPTAEEDAALATIREEFSNDWPAPPFSATPAG